MTALAQSQAAKVRSSRTVTDKDLLGDRERIISQIKQLQTQLKENEIALRVFSRVRSGHTGDMVSDSKSRPQKNILSKSPRKLPDGSEPNGATQSMSDIVRRAIYAQTDQFDSATIVDHMQKYHPDVARRLPPSLVPTILWKLSKDGEVKVLHLNENGEKKSYALSKMT